MEFLDKLAESLGQYFDQYIVHPLSQFTWVDAADIILLAIILYGVYLFFKGRRAGILAIGLILIFAFYAISGALGLRAIHRLLAGIAPFTVIVLVIIFQSELREALEKLGSSPLTLFFGSNKERADLAHTVNEVVEAVCQIALTAKDGALIVIERSIPLGDYADKGHALDALVTSHLLCNIFVDRSPLHDGAVIIRNNRIAAAGSKLPLSISNDKSLENKGTRHRAAVGITEVSDCVVVVVSEERHQISIANNGFLTRYYNSSSEDFRNELSTKTIQNTLRNDLFHILAGVSFDEEARSDKKNRADRKGHRKLAFSFRWRRSTPTDGGKMAEKSAEKSGEKSGGKSGFSDILKPMMHKRSGKGVARRDLHASSDVESPSESTEE